MNLNSEKNAIPTVIAVGFWKLETQFSCSTRNRKTGLLKNFPKKMWISEEGLRDWLRQLKMNQIFLNHLHLKKSLKESKILQQNNIQMRKINTQCGLSQIILERLYS